MTNIAIIGTGIAGLGCGYLLHRRFEVSLFDGNGYAGGHTNTIAVDCDGEVVPVDTGFMVFNEVTYPRLTRLFARLGVETVPSSMSFGVQHRGAGIEYCGSSVDQLFAQRRNLVRPRFLGMLRQITRFNREAREALADPRFAEVTLEQYVQARGYGTSFRDLFLLPMAGAVWSTPFEDVRHFPITTLLRFFDNHGLLGGLEGHHPWLTVRGGAKRYVESMTRDFRERIELGNAVRRVDRDGSGVTLSFAHGERRRFDRVIFACHADEALALLADPTAEERRLLAPFRYQRNVALLHTDPAPMPRARKAWASWNVRVAEDGDGRSRATTIYWMNSLQHLSPRQDYFVSIDDPGLVDPARVLRTIVYHHPLFNLEPNGLVALQAIVCPEARYESLRRGVDFIQKHIFPGGMIPSVGALLASVQRSTDFTLRNLADFGDSYARTLALWAERFEENRERIRAMGFDEVFLRKWRYYFFYCMAAFRMRHVSVVQLLLTRPNNHSLQSAVLSS